MGLLNKAWQWLKGIVQGRYEAAYQRWGERSWLGQALQDARLDVDTATRKELQRRHRYWVCNSELVNRIRNLKSQFSVGSSGLEVVPNSGDEDWNHTRTLSWQRWCMMPDLGSRLPMSQICIQWSGCLFDDGEIFVLKTQDGLGRPAIQNIEAHRIETPPDLKGEEAKTIVDGQRVDKSGRPISYFVRDMIDREIYREIPAKDMIHAFKARRPGFPRGIPDGVSGMNTLHDYSDLHLLEMQCAKLASSIGNVETNPTGEVDLQATRRARMDTSSMNASGQLITKNADQFYKVTIGASQVALKAGDSLKQFQVDRPSIATQNYWDLLISQICSAYNVPKLLVVPYSLQGTVTRADLDVCTSAFRADFEIIAWVFRQIYEWQTEWAIRYDRSLDGARPLDYSACIIRPPRAPNVDIGYNAKALQTELELGVKTIQDVYAEKQQDWRLQLRQIAETESYIDQLGKEFGIDPSRISQKAVQQQGKSSSGGGSGDGDSPEATIPILYE